MYTKLNFTTFHKLNREDAVDRNTLCLKETSTFLLLK